MLKKWVIGFMICAFCVSSYITAFADIYVDQYSEWTQLYEEGKLKVNPGWVKLRNASGCYVWRYINENGEYITDSTTPDGYKVNRNGNWYMHCPSAEICEAEYDYIYPDSNVHYYPVSYDGTVVKNDVLGISLTYGESDYNENVDLIMSNGAGATAYGLMRLSWGSYDMINFSIVAHETRETIQETIDRANQMWAGQGYVFNEQTLCGKNMIGYIYNSDISTIKNLQYQLPMGNDLLIEIRAKTPENIANMENWLANHLVFTR